MHIDALTGVDRPNQSRRLGAKREKIVRIDLQGALALLHGLRMSVCVDAREPRFGKPCGALPGEILGGGVVGSHAIRPRRLNGCELDIKGAG